MQKDVRLEIAEIAKELGYCVVHFNGKYFIDNRKYKVYFVNGKRSSYNYSDVFAEITCDFVVKKVNQNGKLEEVGRKTLKTTNQFLKTKVQDLLIGFRRLGYLGVSVDNWDFDLDNELKSIAKEYNLNSPYILDALKEAFDLGVEMSDKLDRF